MLRDTKEYKVSTYIPAIFKVLKYIADDPNNDMTFTQIYLHAIGSVVNQKVRQIIMDCELIRPSNNKYANPRGWILTKQGEDYLISLYKVFHKLTEVM